MLGEGFEIPLSIKDRGIIAQCQLPPGKRDALGGYPNSKRR
jgi:hypothetical protein